MSLVSIEFYVFLLALFILYFAIYAIAPKYQWLFLLIGSYAFYVISSKTQVMYLLAVTLTTYFAAIIIEASDREKIRKLTLAACLIINIGLLSVVKFDHDIIMPLGISFYIFQSTGYLIDTYRGTVKAERNLLKYALFVSFFPQIIQGPIGRYDRLSPQLYEGHGFEYDRFTKGIIRLSIGTLKKVFIANTLTQYVDIVFAEPGRFSGSSILLAGFLYTMQLYADFSGYMDIVTGVALCLGIEIDENFNTPYMAVSVKDFWRRWHMTLSSWFRDYLYIPMGGNRKGNLRKNLNVFVTMTVSGIWHGTGWNFVIWGALHGIYQVVENILPGLNDRKDTKGIKKACYVAVTFLLVMIAWIVFRVNNTADIVVIAKQLVGEFYIPGQLGKVSADNDLQFSYWLFVSVGIILTVFFDLLQYIKNPPTEFVLGQKKVIRWILMILVMFVIFLFINNEAASSNNFLYYRF